MALTQTTLAEAVLRLLEQATQGDRKQELIELYNELKPEMEGVLRARRNPAGLGHRARQASAAARKSGHRPGVEQAEKEDVSRETVETEKDEVSDEQKLPF